ncbi:70 kDa peptidyl-prolyl isomerase-like [Planoprotostelium fungivorum]|uniref:peptidylprolyl isomerase n=1 Tax=Planoprotostelium fungivorum TaxID=1890364 RepID=A0A2P6N6Z4_9EUKA|nr:70 kDa peptidyl-prolyl isomerase-like [Planoprotostelium fungivorum]
MEGDAMGEQPDYLTRALQDKKFEVEPNPSLNVEEDISENNCRGVLRLLTKDERQGNYPEEDGIVELSIVGTNVSNNIEFENRTVQFTYGKGCVSDGLEMALSTLSQGDEATVTIKSEYNTFVIDQKEHQDADHVKARSQRMTPPANATVKYQVKVLYIENLRGRGLPIQEKNETSIRMKEEGNLYFAAKRYLRAQKKYEKAIEFTYDDPNEQVMSVLRDMDADKPTRRAKRGERKPLSVEQEAKEKEQKEVILGQLQLNLCATRNKLKKYDEAVQGCNLILKKDENHLKALYRRAQAYIGLNDLEKATTDLNRILKREADNEDARQLLKKIQQTKENDKKKQQKVYKRMFDGIVEEKQEKKEEKEEEIEGKIEVIDNGLNNLLGGFMSAFFSGGITQNHIYAMNLCFIILFGLCTSFILNRDLGFHGYVFLGLLAGLFVSVQWVLSQVDLTKKKTE